MNRSAHTTPSQVSARHRRPSQRAAVCQMLEGRQMLAIDIQWVNRGSDSFATYFGANAGQARLIVDRAIEDWEAVITNFNRLFGGSVFELTVTAEPVDGRGVSNVTGSELITGKPTAGFVKMDDNGGGAGWHFDPFIGVDGIPEDGEFDVPISPFTAGGGPDDADFYRTAIHEIGHDMGIYNGGVLGGLMDDVGDDPNSSDADDRLLGVDTNDNGIYEYTLTSNGGGHLFEGGGSYSGPTHPNALMNSGRTYINGRRQLIGDVESDILRDGLGYTVVSPNTINTFWANLNRDSNTLTVTGDINASGSNNDSIIIDVVGTNTRIRVGGTTELIPSAEYTTLVVNAGDGTDTISIDSAPSGKTITINGQGGNDLVILSDTTADLDSGIDSDVIINGGTGTDSVRADDQNDGINSDTYAVTSTTLVKGARTFNLNADLEQLTVNGSAQPSTWNVTSTSFTLIVNAGAGNDTFNVGGGDVDSNLDPSITLNGGGGTDRIDFEDALDTFTGDTYTFGVNVLTKGGQTVNYATMEGMIVNASAQASTFNLDALGAALPTTINGGAGNETFFVGNGDIDSNVDSNVTLNGGGGTDSVTFEDSTDGSGDNIYTLTSTTLSKPARTYNYSGFESLVVTGSALAATFNVNGSSSASTIVNGGVGTDTVNVGGGDLDTNLGENITVNGGGGLDQLFFDDTADGINSNTATFTSGLVVKGGQNFVYTSFSSLVWSGPALTTTYNVNGTVSGTPVTINGGAANDFFNVGGGDYDSLINGSVHVNGGGATDRLTINDTADVTALLHTYEVNGSTFTKSSAGGINTTWGGIVFGTVAIDEFILNASPQDSNIDVNATGGAGIGLPPPVFPIASTINGGDGNDLITVATGGNLSSIRGNITINGQGGTSDTVIFNDASDSTADSFTVTHNTLTNSNWNFAATINAATEALTLEAGTGANAIAYNATAAGPGRVLLNGNNGVDTFDVVEGTATVHGGAGLDHVQVNATLAGTATAVFNGNEDLGNLHVFTGGTVNVTASGNTVIDANNTGILSGALNVADNMLISRTGVPSFIADKLQRGYNGGAWNGVPAASPGGVIRSSVAAASALRDSVGYAQIGAGAGQLNLAVLGGVPVAAGNVVVRYTLAGDANLDRSVNFADLVSLAQNYNQTSRNWVQGDVNYDATTNFADLVLLAQNYNATLSPAPSAPQALAFQSTAKELRKRTSRVGADVIEQAYTRARTVKGATTTTQRRATA